MTAAKNVSDATLLQESQHVVDRLRWLQKNEGCAFTTASELIARLPVFIQTIDALRSALEAALAAPAGEPKLDAQGLSWADCSDDVRGKIRRIAEICLSEMHPTDDAMMLWDRFNQAGLTIALLSQPQAATKSDNPVLPAEPQIAKPSTEGNAVGRTGGWIPPTGATKSDGACHDCGHREPCDDVCPNCNDANEYGDYEGPSCEVCGGIGCVDTSVTPPAGGADTARREQIARIIDPESFHEVEQGLCILPADVLSKRLMEAKGKADAILALPPALDRNSVIEGCGLSFGKPRRAIQYAMCADVCFFRATGEGDAISLDDLLRKIDATPKPMESGE